MAKKTNNSSQIKLNGVAQSVAQKEPDKLSYVITRGNKFQFSRRAPSPLVPGMALTLGDQQAMVGANGYVRFSLNTSDLKRANSLGRKYAHLLDLAAEQLEKQLAKAEAPQSHIALTAEDIQFAADSMYTHLLAADEQQSVVSLEAAFEGESEDVLEPDRVRWNSTALPPNNAAGQMRLLQDWHSAISFFIFSATGKHITDITPNLLPFANAIRRYVSSLEKRNEGDIVPTPALPHKQWSWENAFEYYFVQRKDLDLADGTKDNYGYAWSGLQAASGVSLFKLTKDHVVVWKDELLSKLDAKTVLDKLRAVKAIWTENYDNSKIPEAIANPFRGIKVHVSDNKEKRRKPYSDEELQKIFSAPPVFTAKAVSIQAGYWLPLLALYHGSRLEELTGLEVVDIEDWEQTFIIHIRLNEIRPRLKNMKKSERSFPLHPQLLKLGFGEYVRAARAAGVKALFPSYGRGATFGEEFAEHVRKLIEPVEEKRLIGMHCFRHNWETERRNGRLDKDAKNYMAGRALDDDSSADYGLPAGRKVLLEELSKIQYGPLSFLPAPAVTPGELISQDEIRKRELSNKRTRRQKKPG